MGFLQEDKRGYCQQFSGAMALMLRMAGIPARWRPASRPARTTRTRGEYRVRDLDAHSWVEVWFTGIGWVPFDPTPARSPARVAVERARRERRGAARARLRTPPGRGRWRAHRRSASAAGGEREAAGWSWPWCCSLVVAPARCRGGAGRLAASAACGRCRRTSSRARSFGAAPRAGAAGLEPPRVDDAARPRAPAGPPGRPERRRPTRGALRANRYDPRAPAGPSLRQRRQLRRELSRGSVLGRLRGLIAIPPGAPRA